MGRPPISALILAGCLSSAGSTAFAATGSPLRDALVAGGGCGPHRALVERRLGGLDEGPGAAQPAGSGTDLFGKPAEQWSESEIRDALAAYAACEAQGLAGRSAGDARRRARDLARFEAALRRVVALSRAQGPAPDAAPHQPRRAESDAQASADPGGRGSRPAFVPAAPGAKAEAERAGPAPRADEAGAGQERIERVSETGPTEAPPGLPSRIPVAPAPEPSVRLSAFAAVPPERRPATDRLHCPVVLRSFELLRADMLLPEVETVMGCRGMLESSTTVAGIGDLDVYVWSDRGQSFTVTATFQNRRLRVKSQRGLN